MIFKVFDALAYRSADLRFPGDLSANSNWVWDSLACEIECIQFGVAVLTKIACLAKQAFCLPPTPNPKASSCGS